MTPSYATSRWLFLRALAVVYLIAFVSLWTQVQGLIGPNGIVPAEQLLDLVRQHAGGGRYWDFPTVLWFGAGAGALNLVCGLGALGALVLLFDFWPRGVLAMLWVLYLSLVSVGRDFLSFQWDALLLETGFLALLLAPGHLHPRRQAAPPPVLISVILLWGLLFRLVFESGVVKLTSGDPTWRDLTALDYHFWTQPLATWTAWYVNLMPEWVKKLGVVTTFLAELVAPILIWLGRRTRRWAFVAIVGFQLLIFGTGNYTFFNLLTITLALLLIDDEGWKKALPGWVLRRVPQSLEVAPSHAGRIGVTIAAVPLLVLGFTSLLMTVGPRGMVPLPALQALALVSPLSSVNGYGLFRVMTTTRPEIIVEGSDDGSTWKPYEFRYKPGALDRRPGFVEPHQPRLDWQMWFAALDQYEISPWFQAFMLRLLQGSPDVLRLLATNPFPDHPPKYLRAILYNYEFTDLKTRRATGNWWRRTELGPYTSVLSLSEE